MVMPSKLTEADRNSLGALESTERKWMDAANRINQGMQVEAQILTKETADSTLIGYQH
jgi:hypothetical protein